MDELTRGRRFTEISAEIAASEQGVSAIRGAESLNQKTSALLTHVSIMMAVITTFLGTSGHGAGQKLDVLLVTEMVAYLLICMICLRTIWVSSSSSYRASDEGRGISHIDRLILITAGRRRVYRWALIGTMLITLAFVGELLYYAMGNTPVTWDVLWAGIQQLPALLPHPR